MVFIHSKALPLAAGIFFSASSAAEVALYGQCGGTGFTGSTSCASGAVCQSQNAFYYQCVEGTATASSVVASSSALAPVTTAALPSSNSTIPISSTISKEKGSSTTFATSKKTSSVAPVSTQTTSEQPVATSTQSPTLASSNVSSSSASLLTTTFPALPTALSSTPSSDPQLKLLLRLVILSLLQAPLLQAPPHLPEPNTSWFSVIHIRPMVGMAVPITLRLKIHLVSLSLEQQRTVVWDGLGLSPHNLTVPWSLVSIMLNTVRQLTRALCEGQLMISSLKSMNSRHTQHTMLQLLLGPRIILWLLFGWVSMMFGNSFWDGVVTPFDKILDQYFAQLQILYDAGIRYFTLFTIPPFDQAPVFIGQTTQNVDYVRGNISTYNADLVTRLSTFKTANSGVTGNIFNTTESFYTALKNPAAYNATDATCTNSDGTTCLWYDNYHPGQAIQKLVAQNFVKALTGTFF
ncbi:hypothetical protein EYC84_006042 [Monilinia fructicola]|uniref:CBM1 domain-containing protein n=1 Tax=Monilinia fructicola TaxID=38448 RepID=A0A5M9K116_MONFR|nr:hypothetical protein EYC84_006042 [Monilinia fructicola]